MKLLGRVRLTQLAKKMQSLKFACHAYVFVVQKALVSSLIVQIVCISNGFLIKLLQSLL